MKSFTNTQSYSKSKKLGLALCLTLVGLAFSQVAQGQSTASTSKDIHRINEDRTNVTTSYQMHRNQHVWNMTNGGNGKFHLHYTNAANPNFGNQNKFYTFDDFSFEARTGTIKIIQDGPDQSHAELDIRARNRTYSNRFSISQSIDGGAGIFNHGNAEIEFGTNGTGRMWIAANGNIGIGDDTPGANLTVVGSLRASNEAGETNYLEIGHGGSNTYLNHIGAGNMVFRHEGTNQMTLTDQGRLGIGGSFTPSANLEVRGTGIITGDMSLGGAVNTTGVFTASGASQFNDAVTTPVVFTARRG
ncbi:MAG: hypothetical protein AAFQ98_25020, partial [Bacteroidota bacterium]